MAYQVIARKYRPQRFADVVGQEHVTQTLANAIEQKRIAHAYLFVGPRGTGKTTLARIFAKCLNCTGGPKVDFAEDDPRAKEIADGRSLDVMEIDGASNRGIEEIRELRETVKYAPASSSFKIYIIDEVHMLTKEAFNALLKTLEEPPEHVKFMFATTEAEKVLPTILSRCQRFDLRRIPSVLIVKHLAHISKLEGVEIDEPALYAIARGADGGMRDAESTLDQLISFCGNRIVESDVLSMFGLTARAQILALADSVLRGDAEAVLREFNELVRNGKDLSRLISDLLSYFRNLLLFQVSKGDLSLLEVSEAEVASLRAQASRAELDTLTRIMDVMADAESRLRDAASKRISVEVALMKAIQARNSVSIDSVLQRLKALRDGDSGPAPVAQPAAAPAAVPRPAPVPVTRPAPSVSEPSRLRETPVAPAAPPTVPEPASAPVPAPAPAPISKAAPAPTPAPVVEAVPEPVIPPPAPVVSGGSTNLETLWQQVLEAVGRASPFARSYLIEAHPVAFVRNVLTIGFDPEFADHLSMVDSSRNRELLQTKLSELGHRDAQVKFIQAPAPANWTRPAPAAPSAPPPASSAPASSSSGSTAPKASPAAPPAAARPRTEPVSLNKDDFKNDPLIKKALEIFKGTIVEVRA